MILYGKKNHFCVPLNPDIGSALLTVCLSYVLVSLLHKPTALSETNKVTD